MTIEKKLKSVLLFLGICLGIYVIFILYYLFGDGCWNCSPQDYYARGIAMIPEKDNNDLKKGVKYLKTAAKKGNIEAIIFLGELYLDYFPDAYITDNKGKIAALRSIVSANIKERESYFNELIKNQSFFDRKYSKMQFNLGMLYKVGLLKSEEKEEAYKKWLTISADNGNPLAIYQMGIYFNNQGKYIEALKWFTKAFDSSQEPASAIMIGDYYFYGKGMAKDYQRSIEWYQQALSAPSSPDISLWIKDREELNEWATQRLNIAEKKVCSKISKQLVIVKYRIIGGLNSFSIFTSDLNGNLIGKVKKQNGYILARSNIMIKSVSISKSTKVDSMSEGLHWVLTTYADNKYGVDKDFNFVITK
ncbi:MAG: sel1 repeat family protein [Desulfobacteraceae bacterium]|nr:sel1 repeat family protein [Desulfobacteraceae bacterium]MBC2719021.1 sel1 repeat family protein [Desulfobacteraceae bacterium]